MLAIEKLFVWPALCAALALAVASSAASAAPIFQAQSGDLVVMLHDEPCALKEVANLKFRATWKQGAEYFEGCWGASQLGVVMLYFTDRTVAAMPMRMFVHASGT